MGVASGCGEQEVGVASGSGWNLWVWLLGAVVRRYIDFLILLIPTLVSVLFCSSIPIFCSFSINTHTGDYVVQASHGSHMKAAHNVLYKKKHTQTNAPYPAMDISCMPSRGWV